MINERPLSNVSESLQNDLNGNSPYIDRHIKAVKDVVESETFQIQAFNGGCKDFSSEADIKHHYQSLKDEARTKGMSALDRLTRELASTMSVYFRLDTETIAATQTKLNLATLSDSDIKRIASSGNDDYSVLQAVASYGLEHDSQYAKTVYARLRDFETEAATTCEKINKFASEALAGDVHCMSEWVSWSTQRIDRVKDAYGRLQAAIDGTEKLGFSDMFLGLGK